MTWRSAFNIILVALTQKAAYKMQMIATHYAFTFTILQHKLRKGIKLK